MGLLSSLGTLARRVLGVRAKIPFDPKKFMLVTIPEPPGWDNGDEYAARLEPFLARNGAGEVTGVRTSSGLDRPDGTREPWYGQLEIQATDIEAARRLLREVMPTLGATDGSTVHYLEGDIQLQDRLVGDGWQFGEPSHENFPDGDD
jgi:hypothetical protein